MEEKEIKIFQEPFFDTASVPIDIAASAMKIDRQTLRIMLQNNVFGFGKAIKLPGSSQFTYYISPRLFWLETGFVYKRRSADE